MIVCPQCRTSLSGFEASSCLTCGWTKQEQQGLPVYLTQSDLRNQTFKNYSENYEGLALDNLEKSNLDQRYIRNQAKNIADCVRKVAGLDICELGVGQGFLARELLERGATRLTVVDIAPSCLRPFLSIPETTPVLANAEALPFVEEFDVIFCTDVMEHVLNLGSCLISINHALKPKGLACIRVPYRESLLLYSPLTGYRHEFGHIRSFNKDIVKLYMQKAGFKIIKIELDGFGLQMPRDYFKSSERRRRLYLRFQKRMLKILKDPTSVTRWSGWIARIFMRPNEILFIAQKKKTIEINRERGYGLL